MEPLSVITSCDGCGACCMAQSLPPGYAKIVSGQGTGSDADVARVAAMPAQALADIVATMTDSHERLGTPCCWFDMETRACRYYEYRPSLCRHGKEYPHGDQADIDVAAEHAPWIYPGNAHCLEWREIFAKEIVVAAVDP